MNQNGGDLMSWSPSVSAALILYVLVISCILCYDDCIFLSQIAQSICQFYRLCEEGQIQQVMERLGSMPKVSLQNCVDATKEEDIEVTGNNISQNMF